MIRQGTRRFLFLAAWLWLSCLPGAFARPALASLPSPEWSNPADYAPTTSPLKNRVKGSEEWSSGRFSPGDDQTLEIATGSNGCDYESASGRRKWLNRDPIGEEGGFNLYEFCGNDPVNWVDSDGLQSVGFFLRFGVEVGSRPPPIPRPLVEEALKFNQGRNRVNLPDGRAVDLGGKGHGGVPTPHTHCPKPPNPPPFQNFPSGLEHMPRPATLGDILDSIIQLKGSLSVPGTLGPNNAPPFKVIAPPGYIPPPGLIPVAPKVTIPGLVET